jgi:hypothetical protein
MPAWQSPSSCAPRAAMMRSARSVVVAVLMVVCLSEPNFIARGRRDRLAWARDS